MEFLTNLLESTEYNWQTFLKTVLLLALVSFLLGLLGRFIFGKRSNLNHAVSSAIGILFLYAATAVIFSLGGELRQLLVPLPFVSISGSQLTIFSFQAAEFSVICHHILGMVILAFLVNLIDAWLPEGKNLFTWFFFRCLTVLVAMLLHLLVNWLFTTYLPGVIVAYAPAILLCLLVIMLAVGALRLVIGAALAMANPIIGALYTFFFASVIGKQLSKAMLTTLLLSGLVYALNAAGYVAISIASAALLAYIPFLLILLVIWYVVGRVL